MKKLILVDGNSLMYKAYHATAYSNNLMMNSKGLYTNAIYAFVNMITKLSNSEYDAFLVAFDKGKKTFRHDIVDTYKAGRKPMDDEFRVQIPYIKKYLDIANIARYEIELYEADDIIGTFAKQAINHGYQVDVYSSDKDLLQLVDDNITVKLTKKGMSEIDEYTPKSLLEKTGLRCDQMIDLKALMGDNSDNLPGIAGVGEKTAVKLLQEYENLDGIKANIESIKGKLKEKIEQGLDTAYVCQKMCTIKLDTPVEIGFDEILRKEPDVTKLNELFQELEFKTILKNVEQVKSVENVTYEYINSEEKLSKVLVNNTTFLFETLNYNYHNDNIIGVALRNDYGTFIVSNDLITSATFSNFLASDAPKSVFDVKKSIVLLNKFGVTLSNVNFDLRLATYIIDPNIKNDDFQMICNSFEYYNVEDEEKVYGKGVKRAVPETNTLHAYLANKVYAINTLAESAFEKLNNRNQYDLLTKIEIPLSFVLAKMEINGILLDFDELKTQGSNLLQRIKTIEEKIYELAGMEFNIGSVKQLGEVLFEKLHLPALKKTKTGYSTDNSVLVELLETHEIIEHIINYRALTKLHSTYIEGLKNQANENNEIHTIFEQTLTLTGRLSSIEPNLQNIPIRTEDGKNIRKLFVARDNYKLIASDYSQIELRVLASLAKVDKLIFAFNNDEDVHTKTAQDIFHKETITEQERSKAKAVNFGVVYGMSAHGLSETLKISRYEAQNYIDSYYDLYPEIKQFMDNIIATTKVNGFVSTILKRRRYIPEINSSMFMKRQFGERTAMNSVIQGSAADIIKLAMVKLDALITEYNLDAKMLVTVHDEILLECNEKQLELGKELIKKAMEEAYKLDVELSAKMSIGSNWLEAK